MSENENSFEALRRLLALKRHEIPPPGYFEDFSANVIARIRAGQTHGSFVEKFFERAPWLLKLFQALETKPIYSGAFASALCLLLLFGIVAAERPETDLVSQPLLTTTTATAQAENVSPFASGVTATPALPQLVGQPIMAMGNTNPIAGLPANALFSQGSEPMFQQAGFSTGN